MTLYYRIRSLVRWLLRRDEIELALNTDLVDYIERSAAEKIRAGMSEAEARRAARIELGGVEQTKDSVRATLSFATIENTLADLCHAFRTLSRQKMFTAVTVSTLGLGIGVNVAIFSLFQQVLLRPLPVTEPERLVNLTDPGPDPNRTIARASMAGENDTIFSYPLFRDLERAQKAFVGLAAHRALSASLSTGERAQPGQGMFVSGNYFPLLGLRPALGRLLGPEDDGVDGQAQSVVLSHAYWQTEFGGAADVLGRTLLVNGTPLDIVGVAPRGFHGTTAGLRADVFVPITFGGLLGTSGPGPGPLPNHDNRGLHWLHLFARLEPGVTREEAAAAINPLYRTILNEMEAHLVTTADERELSAFRTKPLALEPGARGQSLFLLPAGERLAMLLAASGVVLLLCCANVAGLMLVRGSARTGEMAVRSSLGGTRGRLASLLLAESLALALPAAVASVPVALLTLRGIALTFPGILTGGGLVQPSAAFDVTLSSAGALVAIAIAVLCAIAFGLFPLRSLVRTEPGMALRAYGVRHTSAKGVTRFRTALATVQVALSMALLAVAGLFTQSLANIARIDLGLNVDSVVTFAIAPQSSGYTPEASAQLLDRLHGELETIPGVSSITSATFPLLAGASFGLRGLAVGGVDTGQVAANFVDPGFFTTIGIRLLAGRDFRDADNIDAPRVAIVNRRFAERFAPGADVIGRSVSFGTGTMEIVGVAADAKNASVTGEIGPQVFLPRRQSFIPAMVVSATFYVSGDRPAADLIDAVRETVTRVDPLVPITGLRTLEQQMRDNVATERFVAGISTAFAVLATALAGLGLYGVLAYSVAQRSREIGLRFALGAPASGIRRMVFRQVGWIVLGGVALGVAGAILLGRAARSLLFGIEATDPLPLVAAAAALAAVTFCAAYVPARRAARVDPMSVLRYE